MLDADESFCAIFVACAIIKGACLIYCAFSGSNNERLVSCDGVFNINDVNVFDTIQ